MTVASLVLPHSVISLDRNKHRVIIKWVKPVRALNGVRVPISVLSPARGVPATRPKCRECRVGCRVALREATEQLPRNNVVREKSVVRETNNYRAMR